MIIFPLSPCAICNLVYCHKNCWVPFQSVTFDITSVNDELGISPERPIYFECKLNEPMHIGMRYLHLTTMPCSMGINRQQVQCIFSFSLWSRALFIWEEPVLLGEAFFIVLFWCDGAATVVVISWVQINESVHTQQAALMLRRAFQHW